MTNLNTHLRDIAQRHQLSEASAGQLLNGLLRTGGGQVQFDIPEFGGMGQWMPGMITAGSMFDTQLKARIDAACSDIARLVRSGEFSTVSTAESSRAASLSWNNDDNQWPADLGAASTSGGQNDMRYAWFPSTRRLGIDLGGKISIYDTADHLISGVSQQQSAAGRTIIFTSQHGTLDLSSLKRVDAAMS